MANVLPKDKQIAVIAGLAEGSSLRALTRITGIHRTTIMNLALRVGNGCARLLDEKMRDLTCHYLEFDEIWGFIGKRKSTAGKPTTRRWAMFGRSALLMPRLRSSRCLR